MYQVQLACGREVRIRIFQGSSLSLSPEVALPPKLLTSIGMVESGGNSPDLHNSST